MGVIGVMREVARGLVESARALFDDFTPWEVFREYEARKAELPSLSPERWQAAVQQLEEELGLGMPPASLSEAQRAAQARAKATWGSPR